MFARYIGTNCRNGPPMKKIWVPKSCLENLPMNVIMTPPGKKKTPDQRLHMVQRLHTDRGLTRVTLTPMFCREIILRLMNMSVFLQTAMFIRPRTILHILTSIILLLQGYLLGLQSQSSQMLHLDSLLLSQPWRCGWLRRINSLLQGKVSSRKSKESDAIAVYLKHLVGRKIKCPNGLTMYFVPSFLDSHPVYPNQDFHNPLVRQMFMLHNTLGEAYPPNCTVGYDTKGFRMDYGQWMH